MQIINLNISGYRIRLDTTGTNINLILHPKFNRFITGSSEGYDLRISVSSGEVKLPEDAICIFNAPYFNTENSSKTGEFWSINRSESSLYAIALVGNPEEGKKAVLNFSVRSKEWSLQFETKEETIDPLEYPLDGLIIYYLAVMNRDIFIHASGVFHKEKGYVFSGISGKGKSTMAGLWKERGAGVIHDDRLVLRRNGSQFTMYNTPVYENDIPREAVVSRIYLIEHGKINRAEMIKGAAAVTGVLVNCIQHNWGNETIDALIRSVTDLCNAVPVYRLSFKPDHEVTELICRNE